MKRRLFYMTLIMFLLLTMTGCVFLRLLKMKKQMNDVDRYVRAEEQSGLVMTFLEPILLMKDVEWLMKAIPTHQTKDGEESIWRYDFKKIYPEGNIIEEGNFDLSQTLHFKEGKFYKIAYPQKLSAILSPELVLAGMQAAGKGKVDKKQRRLATTWDHEAHPVKIPQRSEVEAVLGQPFEVERSDSYIKLIYNYQLQRHPDDKRREKMISTIMLTFREKDEKLLRYETSYNKMTTTIDFPNPSGVRK